MKKLMLAIIAVLAITMQSHASASKTIRFEDCRAIITKALETCPLTVDKSVTLLSGFVTESESGLEASMSLVIGESANPMIMLNDNDSNQIYLLALKTILPEIEW
jgi:hypothetical protein